MQVPSNQSSVIIGGIQNLDYSVQIGTETSVGISTSAAKTVLCKSTLVSSLNETCAFLYVIDAVYYVSCSAYSESATAKSRAIPPMYIWECK